MVGQADVGNFTFSQQIYYNFKYSSGVVYIKFSKTSEAAKALEEMNGKTLGTPPGCRPLKVLVASRYFCLRFCVINQFVNLIVTLFVCFS